MDSPDRFEIFGPLFFFTVGKATYARPIVRCVCSGSISLETAGDAIAPSHEKHYVSSAVVQARIIDICLGYVMRRAQGKAFLRKSRMELPYTTHPNHAPDGLFVVS